jgi:hypothetical protein
MRSAKHGVSRGSPSASASTMGRPWSAMSAASTALSSTVIGDTVNTASRLQGLTRTLETPLVVGDPLVTAVTRGPSGAAAVLAGQLQDYGEHALRGRAGAARIWTRETRERRNHPSGGVPAMFSVAIPAPAGRGLTASTRLLPPERPARADRAGGHNDDKRCVTVRSGATKQSRCLLPPAWRSQSSEIGELSQRQSPGVAVAGFRQFAPIHYTG